MEVLWLGESERLLRKHLGEVTKPSRGRGCLRTATPDYISSGQAKVIKCYVNFTAGADLTISDILSYMLKFSLESLKTVKLLVVDNLCKSSLDL